MILETKVGRFRWHEGWIVCPRGSVTPENGRTHGITVDRNGNVFIFRQDVPAMLVFSAGGQLIDEWGEYPGAHGLTLVESDGEELLWLTDQVSGAVHQTTLSGIVRQSIDPPPYALLGAYVPTWVAVNEVRYGGNGDVWVADGYGGNRVNRYNASGDFLASLDGSEGAGEFRCPHGLWFDSRKSPMQLYVADRGNRRVQVFDAGGQFLRAFGEDFLTSPDCFVRLGEMILLPELLGRLTIVGANDEFVCHAGENHRAGRELDAAWPNTNEITAGEFNSPHGAAIDASGSIFVVEWRVGGRVIKLERLY